MPDPVPEISVIIPTHNGARFIPHAIRSVMSQDFSDYEIIVVDDGSDDGTASEIRRQFPEVRVFSQSNGGPARARNHGIRVARGRYVAFLDDDDLWEPQKLSKQVRLLQSRNDLSMVFTDWVPFRDDGTIGRASSRSTLMEGDLVRNIFLYSGVATPTVMVRKAILESVGGFDEELHIGEDDNLWMRIALDAGVSHIPEVLVRVRVRAGSVSRDGATFFREVSNHIELLPRRYPRLYDRLGEEAIRSKRGTIHRAAGYHFFERGDLAEARRHFLSSIRLEPTMLSARLFVLSILPGPVLQVLKGVKRRYFPRFRITRW